MAYSGFLIKVGDYTIPFSWIRAESYEVTLNGQDLDSYRDSNGKLHRNALDHTVAKVEFQTPPLRTDKEWDSFLGNIRRNYTDAKEKKAMVTVYIPEINDYVTQEMYMPDISFEIYYADAKVVKYAQVRLAFIGY